MWLLSSRGNYFDVVFTFLLWMLRYRSRKKKFQPGVYFLPQNRAVWEWRGRADTGSLYRKIGRSKIVSRNFENKCRFGGSKVAVEVWEEIL